MSMVAGKKTVAIREALGNSEASGVSDDVLPVSDDLATLIHGATHAASQSIDHEELSRDGRLRVHVYERYLEGRQVGTKQRSKLSSEAIAVASSGKCERYGLTFHRASIGAILSP